MHFLLSILKIDMSVSISDCDKVPKTELQQAVWNAVKTRNSFLTRVKFSQNRKLDVSGHDFSDEFELTVSLDAQVMGQKRIAMIRPTGLDYMDETFVWVQKHFQSVRETAKFFAELVEICELIEKCNILSTRPRYDFQSLSHALRQPATEFQKALLKWNTEQLSRAEKTEIFEKSIRWRVALSAGEIAVVELAYTNHKSPNVQIRGGLLGTKSLFRMVEITNGKVTYDEPNILEFLKEVAGPHKSACLVSEIMEIVPLMAKI